MPLKKVKDNFQKFIISMDEINVILYANDIENYINERGFYFTFEELPFLLSKNNEELIEIIRTKKELNEITEESRFLELKK